MPALQAVVLPALVLVAAGVIPGPAAATDLPESLSQRYLITATLDVASGRLEAVGELEITNRWRRAIDHVNLSVVPRALSYLTMHGPVTVDGEVAEAAWTTTINLRVPLELERGETATIRIPFRLDVARSPDAFTARTSSQNGVLSFGQWFPILSTEHDVYGVGDPQISFTAESIRLELATTAPLPRDAVACPGLQSAPTTTGTRWVCEVEQVRDFSFAVNPGFRLTNRTAGETEVRAYTETVDGYGTLALAVDGLIRLEQAFGAYPWPDLVLAEVGSMGGFSMEYPRAIHLTREKVVDPYVIYHEVAHQWFYAQVGSDQQAEPWLDEAFADFSARYLMGIGENQCATRPVDSEVFDWQARATTGGDYTSCDGYFHTVFYQGTEFLNAVRAAMGDEPFFAAMRAWIAERRHGFVRGRELLLHLLDSTEADLQPIYERYLEDADPRPYRWLGEYRRGPAGPSIGSIAPLRPCVR